MRFFFNIIVSLPLDNTTTFDQLQLALLSICLISVVLFLLSYENPESLLKYREYSVETTSMYECGFEPFKEPQEFFFVQYFSLAILFLLFDLELIFFLPWILSSDLYIFQNIFIVCCFFSALVLGLVLEWRTNTLNWLKIQHLN